MFSSIRIKRNECIRGFSLLEVLITAAIVGIITALVVIRYSGFNSAVLLKNQAYEVALDVREAQVFTISSRGQSAVFREEYGLYFDSATVNQYLLFYNTNKTGETENPAYHSGEEVGSPRIIDSRFSIADICVADGSNTYCTGDGLNDLAVSFKRPNFDAQFHTTGLLISDNAILSATVVISDSEGTTQSVLISATGQVTIVSS